MTADEMRISDWSSDVCSSDLGNQHAVEGLRFRLAVALEGAGDPLLVRLGLDHLGLQVHRDALLFQPVGERLDQVLVGAGHELLHELDHRHLAAQRAVHRGRSEEHTSELQSLMRISYAVFCLKKKKSNTHRTKKDESQDLHNKKNTS